MSQYEVTEGLNDSPKFIEALAELVFEKAGVDRRRAEGAGGLAMKVAVIGGGISGLTTAFLLERKGVDVTVFEASENVGGNVQTFEKDGYTIEQGPNSLAEIAAACRSCPHARISKIKS